MFILNLFTLKLQCHKANQKGQNHRQNERGPEEIFRQLAAEHQVQPTAQKSVGISNSKDASDHGAITSWLVPAPPKRHSLSSHASQWSPQIEKQPQLVLHHPKPPPPHTAASHSDHSRTQSHGQTSATQLFRAKAVPTRGPSLCEAAAKTPALSWLHKANYGHQLNCLYIQNERNPSKELEG